ncbi:echinoderm microtubule-associated protein-like 4 isoform X4 [Oncorhynchus keta]|uniref:echinoderm microtubule-associated protein-like 4 isoform X4 n=1 Tax=Oncorhynchus keta TaxID=8018 RepID=UPI00227AB509|nr:echinoderm microtubule-associated protein-like 4 isoform X4 [Oncorhynchus keta]
MDGSTNSLDDVSGSSAEYPDRVSMMEGRLQAQEDEIMLLKSSLADALRRLRLHDQLIPLLKQQIIAVNPAAPRVLNQVYCSDGFSSSRKLSSSSALDSPRHPATSQVLNSTEGENGSNGDSTSPGLIHKTPTYDRATQTDLTPLVQDQELDKVPLALTRPVQSLSLEDALPEGMSLTEEARAKFHHIQRLELEEKDEEGEEKDLSWASSVEDAIHPTAIRNLQRDDHQDPNGSTESLSSASQTPISRSPAPPKDLSASPRSGPLSIILEGKKKPLSPLAQPCHTMETKRARRNSEKLVKDPQEKTKKLLDKKAASSANLLNRSPSLESRTKDLIARAGSPGSRRGTQGQSIKMFIRGRPITMYVPSNIQNYEDLRMEPPVEKLELDWVYGYRGRDCRANLYLLSSGEAVYFIACVVVLYHINNRTQRHYRKHTDCVRCLTIHPDKVRVASGQTAGVDKDGKPLQPYVHIWDSSTLITLQQIGLGTFERGVGSVAFSFADAGAFLCVIDDSNEHMLSVWDCAKGTKHTEVKSTNEAVFAVEFNPSDSTNIITCGKSHIYFWTLSAGSLTKKQGIFGKYKKPKFIQCFVFSLTGDVLTGDSEGNILTWGKSPGDVKTLGKGAKETFQIMRQTRAHDGSVFTLCMLQGGALLSGGGKDRKIIRWSADLAPERECEIPEKFGAVRCITYVNGEEVLVGTTRNAILRGTFSDGFVAIVQGHVDEMWGLATHPSQDVFLTCGHDRQVCVWNTAEHKLDWCTTLEEYGLCADFCPNGAVVSVGLSTGRSWQCYADSGQLSVGGIRRFKEESVICFLMIMIFSSKKLMNLLLLK